MNVLPNELIHNIVERSRLKNGALIAELPKNWLCVWKDVQKKAKREGVVTVFVNPKMDDAGFDFLTVALPEKFKDAEAFELCTLLITSKEEKWKRAENLKILGSEVDRERFESIIDFVKHSKRVKVQFSGFDPNTSVEVNARILNTVIVALSSLKPVLSEVHYPELADWKTFEFTRDLSLDFVLFGLENYHLPVMTFSDKNAVLELIRTYLRRQNPLNLDSSASCTFVLPKNQEFSDIEKQPGFEKRIPFGTFWRATQVIYTFKHPTLPEGNLMRLCCYVGENDKLVEVTFKRPVVEEPSFWGKLLLSYSLLKRFTSKHS
ncbi:hypothetical protein L596_009525 [Steinernema carpocapsae]|uniref:Uncharacterized protein n=1 Tax=Steinernema carpocapsae TaxID=34508 RepID=A0A4U5PGX3_STECR|nr:hypothetical protein L596_009525 [Steinernema carpocapsae]